jgi:hypothetical protein
MHDEQMQRALGPKTATKKCPDRLTPVGAAGGPLCNNPTIAGRDGLIVTYCLRPETLLAQRMQNIVAVGYGGALHAFEFV